MLETAAKNIKQLFSKPGQGEMIIFEYIILNLVGKIFADKFNFDDQFVCYQDAAVTRIHDIKENRKMPILVQTFNRFAVFYNNILSEYPALFDCISVLFSTLIYDFPNEAVTQGSIVVINQQKRELERAAAAAISVATRAAGEKQKTSKGGLSDFSTMDTRNLDTTDDDDADYVNGVKVAQSLF
jgi:hypothetical protein